MWIVWLWLLLALAGLLFAVAARQNAKDELKDLGAITNGRRRLGKGHVRDETIVVIIDGTWALIGIFYLYKNIEPSNPAVALPLLLTSGLLALSTLMRWQDRLYAARPHPIDNAQRDLEEDAYMGKERRDMERSHTEN